MSGSGGGPAVHIGIIGAGHIGGNVARRLALAGHEVTVGFGRDLDKLAALAGELGATVAEPPEVAKAEVVVFAVPWRVVDLAIEATGSLEGQIVIDTTNQFGAGGVVDLGQTAARYNANRMRGARYTK